VISRNSITGKCYRDGSEISTEEYARIRELMRNKPAAPDGYAYRFENETWVLHEIPPSGDAVEELTETEEKARAYDILAGVSG
jgi:hypothetical protein